MANTQELLQAINAMQQNAQARVPIIPNNGNPMGANNMPQQAGPPPDRPAMDDNHGMGNINHYPWLAPSPSMAMVQHMLTQPLIQPAPPPMSAGYGTPAPVYDNAPTLASTPGAYPGMAPPQPVQQGPVMPQKYQPPQTIQPVPIGDGTQYAAPQAAAPLPMPAASNGNFAGPVAPIYMPRPSHNIPNWEMM